MNYSGQVHFIPKDADEDGDSKFRRHLLLANCDDDAEVASLAYCSSQPTEAGHGAANVLVNPTRTTYRGTGFDVPTYVYPSRIVIVDPGDLEDPRGRVMDEMWKIREELSKALGLGTGTSSGPGSAAGSWRGRYVRLAAPLAQDLRATYAVIVTDPEYSKAERYQTVVPILSAEEYDPQDRDVIFADTKFLEAVDPGMKDAFLWTEATCAVFHARDIESWSSQTIDDATLADLELALRFYFEL